MTERPVVVVIPDYDGIGPYEFWRANLLAQLGYAGMNKSCSSETKKSSHLFAFAAVPALLYSNFDTLIIVTRGTLCVAAFVADIYGVNQTQGPELNMSQASALSGMYGRNPGLLLDRVGAGIAEVMLCPHALCC